MKNCNTCAFNFGEDTGCAAMYYGKPINEITQQEINECVEYKISLEEFIYQKSGRKVDLKQ